MTTAQDAGPVLLDLFSLSQKTTLKCGYGAPLIATVNEGEGYIGQACCNHWDCPRCKFTLAAYHMHRMAEGAALLMAEGPLYFWTITCRGKDLDYETADDNYLLWTNRLLASCRFQAQKRDGRFTYVQVTERQRRGAAHSHFITTFCPPDGVASTDDKGRDCIFSAWFVKRNVSAGLGSRCLISEVRSAAGAASYIAGYLQKHLDADVWPKRWKRVRYSQDWPDLAYKSEWATALMRPADWSAAGKHCATYYVDNATTYEMAMHRLGDLGVQFDKTLRDRTEH